MNASEQIDQQIAALDDWRGTLIARLRGLINATDPALKEDWKWGTAVWTSDGNICGLAAFKEHVKIAFFKGAALADSEGLFNSGLDARDSRAIDISEGDAVNESALQDLIRAAVAYNQGQKKSKAK